MMEPSDSDSDIEEVCSQPAAPVSHDSVPETKDFKLKFYGATQGSKSGTKMSFKLKEGKSLPYYTITTTKKGRGI